MNFTSRPCREARFGSRPIIPCAPIIRPPHAECSYVPDLARRLSDATALVFGKLGFDAAHAVVRRSDRPDLADFQCNGALAIAKAAGRKPVEIARSVAEAWEATALAQKPSIAGPGFLNYRVLDTALCARAQEIASDPRSGASTVERRRRVLVDYGGPNVAKPMHVGHLRASIIGESLKRIFRYCGDTVWGDAHFGDWGFQMGLLIADYEVRFGAIDPDANLDASGRARLATVALDDLQTIYPEAAERAKNDAEFRDRARQAT